MLRNMTQIMRLVDEFSAYLSERGIVFTSQGLPVLPRAAFLDEWPHDIVDYSHRNAQFISGPSTTLICFFRDDLANYRRLEHVLDDVSEYKRFLGVTATDVTVTADMDIEWQKATMLLNQLFMAVLAVNGVKVAMNARCGAEQTQSLFAHIPRDVLWVSSSLGCASLANEADLSYVAKIVKAAPSKLALYGKRDPLAEQQLTMMGVNWRSYPDVHQKYKKSELSVGDTKVIKNHFR